MEVQIWLYQIKQVQVLSRELFRDKQIYITNNVKQHLKLTWHGMEGRI